LHTILLRESVKTMIDNNKIQEVADAAQAFEEDFEHDYLSVEEAYYEYDADDGGSLPQYRTHVVISDVNDYETTYTYLVRDFGVEQGLYLFDTVTNWEDRTVTLRFGIANE